MSRVWWVWALTAAIACTGDEGSDSDDTDEPVDTDGTDGCLADPMTVSPGTGDLAYVALQDGDPVTIWHGPQGGWHIDTAGYVQHTVQSLKLHPKVTAVGLGLGLAGTEPPMPTADPPDPGDIGEFKALAFYSDAECDGEFWGVRAFVDDVVTPPSDMTYQEFICSLEGQELSLTIDVEDLASGRTATATVSVIAALDPVVDAPVCP